MISKISAKGLKGLEFEQPLLRLNLFRGPNGIGKSARTDAVLLAVLGYLPGGAKRPGDILNALGSGDKMFVGIETDDHTHFLRRYAKDEKGTVNQSLMVNRRKASGPEYAKAMAGVRVIDLRIFLELSDQKQIDTIFSLFPPAGDVRLIKDQIGALRAKKNGLQAKIETLDGVVARLKSGRAEIQLPAGTLSEITGKIEDTEKQLTEARQSLRNVEIAQVRAEEQEKAEAAAILKTEQEREAQGHKYVKPKPEEIPEGSPLEGPFKDITPRELIQDIAEMSSVGRRATARLSDECSESIQAILASMQRSGCDSCAAALVAKRELRKYQKREVA